MTVYLNDKGYEVESGISLLGFLQKLDIRQEGIAIAINYSVVPKSKWEETILTENQELMLIQAVSGG